MDSSPHVSKRTYANLASEYLCPICARAFTPKRRPRTSEPTCSDTCRAERSRRKQRWEIEAALAVLRKALKLDA